jgi:hypothetical protein
MFVRKSLRQAGFILLAAALLLTACNMGATPAPTVDVNAINTAAVATAMGQLSAQFTQTALAAPPAAAISTNTAVALPTSAQPATNGALPTVSFNSTPVTGATPLAGFTPLASPLAPTVSSGPQSTANGCNDALFMGETIPDKTQFNPGKAFSKAWQLQNTGTCTWDEGYTFAFLADVSSPEIAGYDIVIKSTDESTKPGHSQSFIVKLTAPSKSGEYFGYWKMKDDAGNFFGPRVYLDIIVK